MLGLEDFMTIQALVKRGVYLCDIAEQLGVHPKTVSRAVQRGGPPDYAAAAQWYRRAAESGYSRAVISLGNLYENGVGVPKDSARAQPAHLLGGLRHSRRNEPAWLLAAG